MSFLDQLVPLTYIDQLVRLCGDINGRSFIGPQPLNYNVKGVVNIMEEWNMILLNGDIKRRQGNIGVTHFILVNENKYKYFENMYEDEEKEKIDWHAYRYGSCSTCKWSLIDTARA